MPLHRNVKRALVRFEQAVEAKAWKGSRPPEEHAEINRAYRKAKEKLVEILQRVPDEFITSRCEDAEVQRKGIPSD